jgi:hypothetical protein
MTARIPRLRPTPRPCFALCRAALVGVLVVSSAACKGRVSRAQCDQLLGRFAELVVKEKLPTASPEAIRAEQAREREEAARDDNFKNCTTELRADEYRCAMAAPTAEALIKCLE